MGCHFMRKLWPAFCLLLVLPAAVGARQTDSDSHVRPEHAEVLRRWLKTRPTLRAAAEADCANREGLAATRAEYGETYHPYYVVGDFNRDGTEDFAVALVDSRRRASRFAIAIFNGAADRRAATPSFFTDGVDLSDGGLILRPDGLLLAGTFQSDSCVVLRPRGRTYVMQDCL